MKLQELGKVDVELLTAETGVHLRCKRCGAKWAPDSTPGGTLMPGYWNCPKGCNARLTREGEGREE